MNIGAVTQMYTEALISRGKNGKSYIKTSVVYKLLGSALNASSVFVPTPDLGRWWKVMIKEVRWVGGWAVFMRLQNLRLFLTFPDEKWGRSGRKKQRSWIQIRVILSLTDDLLQVATADFDVETKKLDESQDKGNKALGVSGWGGY